MLKQYAHLVSNAKFNFYEYVSQIKIIKVTESKNNEEPVNDDVIIQNETVKHEYYAIFWKNKKETAC